jgi:putative protease
VVDKKVELLAPVGSMESLYAAVQNGANAVYLGGKLFSARQYASNFDYDELKLAVQYAHLRDVKVYVTVNILIDDKEMKEILDYIKYLYEIDVDGLIIQDLGLAYLLRKIFSDFELHASTQMTINNLPGAVFLEKLGFKRVVLARETPLKEIEYIHNSTDIELESFIHGALCVCYSGQCLMSSILGGRSGNRGRCAQPCRMPYSIIDYYNQTLPFDEWNKKYILSPKDLNTLDYIDDIIKKGISSLKIEGRMKRPEYVATVVKNYRKALDFGKHNIIEKDKKEVTQIFNRGFTKGIMLGDFGKDFISYNRPDNRGILIGEVSKIDKKNIYTRLYENVEDGDGIELETIKGDYIGIILNFSANKGETIKIDNTFNISIGSKVYKTSSKKLLEEAKESFQNEKIKYPIHMGIIISIGKPAELTIKYDKNKTIKVQSKYIVEKAEKVGLTEDKVINQLSKLNDTVYYIDNIDIELEENSFMPVREINGLRREGIEKIDSLRKKFNKRNLISNKDYKNTVNKYFTFNRIESQNERNISISVLKKEQFKQLNLNKLDRLYIGFYDGLQKAVLEAKEQGKEVYLLTDKILYSKDLDRLKKTIQPVLSLIDGVSVSNFGTLQFVKDNFDTKIHGDIGLNIFNSFAIDLLQEEGLKSITLSPELTMSQIENLYNKGSIICETLGYGYLPLMITKHCPMSLIKGCKDDLNCKNCPYSEGYGLKDRKNINFYMERKEGFTTIYNSVPLMILDNLDQIYENKVNMIRLDFTFERENIKELQEIYFNYAKGIVSKDMVNEFIKEFRDKNHITKGHYFRGVI